MTFQGLFPDECPHCGDVVLTLTLWQKSGVTHYRQCQNPHCQCLFTWKRRPWPQVLFRALLNGLGYAVAVLILWLIACFFLALGN